MQSINPLPTGLFIARHLQPPEAAISTPAPLKGGAGVGALRSDKPIRQLIGRSRRRLDPEGAKGLGGEHHLTHHRQKRCRSTEATPLRRGLIVITAQQEGFTTAPDPCNRLKLVHRQALLTTQGPHPPRQHIADTRPAGQPCAHGAPEGMQLLQHLPHPASTPDAHRLICSIPGDPRHGATQIQRPLAFRRSPGAGAATADP